LVFGANVISSVTMDCLMRWLLLYSAPVIQFGDGRSCPLSGASWQAGSRERPISLRRQQISHPMGELRNQMKAMVCPLIPFLWSDVAWMAARKTRDPIWRGSNTFLGSGIDRPEIHGQICQGTYHHIVRVEIWFAQPTAERSVRTIPSLESGYGGHFDQNLVALGHRCPARLRVVHRTALVSPSGRRPSDPRGDQTAVFWTFRCTDNGQKIDQTP
jgi:hypothetical protein